MPINIQTKKPQPVQFAAVDNTLSFELVENETVDDTNDYAEVIVRATGIQLADIPFSNIASSMVGSTVTANAGANTFTAVRVGDGVSGANIPSATTVTAINGDFSELTLDNAPIADVDPDNISVTPQVLDATIAKLRLNLSVANNTDLRMESVLYTFDGSVAKEKRDDVGEDAVVVADASTTNRTARNVNVNTFLSNVNTGG